MSKKSDAAARVYGVLRDAKRCDNSHRIRTVWATAFKVDENKVEVIYRHLFLSLDQLDEAESQIKNGEADTKLFLRHFPTIRKILTPSNLDGGWADTRTLLTEQALESLEYCSDYLKKHVSELEVPDDELEKLRTQIQEIIDEIAKCDLPKAAKQILSDIARSLKDALHEQRIRGINGMFEELFIIRARMERNWVAILQQKDEPLVQRLFTCLKNWQITTSAYLNTSQISASIFPVLMDAVSKL